jgi:hypothetical protein
MSAPNIFEGLFLLGGDGLLPNPSKPGERGGLRSCLDSGRAEDAERSPNVKRLLGFGGNVGS